MDDNLPKGVETPHDGIMLTGGRPDVGALVEELAARQSAEGPVPHVFVWALLALPPPRTLPVSRTASVFTRRFSPFELFVLKLSVREASSEDTVNCGSAYMYMEDL